MIRYFCKLAFQWSPLFKVICLLQWLNFLPVIPLPRWLSLLPLLSSIHQLRKKKLTSWMQGRTLRMVCMCVCMCVCVMYMCMNACRCVCMHSWCEEGGACHVLLSYQFYILSTSHWIVNLFRWRGWAWTRRRKVRISRYRYTCYFDNTYLTWLSNSLLQNSFYTS